MPARQPRPARDPISLAGPTPCAGVAYNHVAVHKGPLRRRLEAQVQPSALPKGVAQAIFGTYSPNGARKKAIQSTKARTDRKNNAQG